jgi:3-hydroxyacyl-[acyl-carrier-protein] dehydratase
VSDQRISLEKILPHAYPFLLIDRVVEIDAGKRVICLKNISCDEDMLQGYSPHDPVFPPVYIVEAMAQASGLLLNDERSGGAFLSMMKDVAFHKEVRPGDRLMITSSLFHAFSPLFVFRVKAHVEDKLVAEAEITLALTNDE